MEKTMVLWKKTGNLTKTMELSFTMEKMVLWKKNYGTIVNSCKL